MRKLVLIVGLVLLSCSKIEIGQEPGRSAPEEAQSIRILAIGNSFSCDAMEYLFPILKELGYKDIELGNLYIGGCSLQTHASNIESNKDKYIYYYNNAGKWKTYRGVSANKVVASKEWDIITLQQVSWLSGQPESYEPFLTYLINSIHELAPSSRIMWHMTWAYQQDSTHEAFAYYNNDQMTMYESIIASNLNIVLSHPSIESIIASGTAIQNLRTSFIGDSITRDGYHLSYDIGRYTIALLWARQITGEKIDCIQFTPQEYYYSEKQIAAIKESVEYAYCAPYSVSISSFL